MAYPKALAGEAAELQDNIKGWKEDEATARTAADAYVASIKEKGEDPMASEHFDAIDEKYKAADTLLEQIDEGEGKLLRLANRAGGEHNPSAPPAAPPASPEVVAWAQRVLQSDQYAALVDSGVLAGSGHVEMPGVEYASRDETRAVFQAATLDGSPLVPSDRRLMPPIPTPLRQIRLLDLITVGDTDSDTVEWTQETTNTNAATGTAYGTAAPESAYAWTKKTATVRRIPHHVVATKGNLMDQGQMRTLLDANLVKGCRLTGESQILAGDGTGENFTGVVNAAGIGTQAKGADSTPDAIHKAMTVVRLALEDDITAIGLHPTDYQTLVLEKGSDGQYLHHQGWQTGTPRSIWGYPAVVSTVFTQGTAVAADWSQAMLWMRTGISVAASDSHSDFFLKGLVAILAEFRAAFAVTQAKGFCQVTGL